MKTSDNTHISEIDRFTHPATSTMIDRYVLASHWTKGKTVLDAATGYGYGAGIVQSLGANGVVATKCVPNPPFCCPVASQASMLCR